MTERMHPAIAEGCVAVITGAASGIGRAAAHALTGTVNFWGVVNGVQVFTELMLKQNTPCAIVNTGSKQGITNPPGNPAYNATKAGAKSVTESLSHELRNTVAMGSGVRGCLRAVHGRS